MHLLSLKNAFRARLPSKLHRQLIHQHHLQSHLHCGNDPIQLQTTMEFCRPRMHEKHLKPHLQCGTDPTMVRDRSDHGPPMIRPHTRPSRNRRTAEVDQRGSGTDFVWKNIGFCASAISQKRISCETSSKTRSATPPPAPLAIPFTLRERSYTVANHNGILSTAHARKTLETPFTMRNRSDHGPRPIRPWSAHDPTTHETVSQPSHRRGRSARFGDGLCMEKHIGFRASAISQKRISCETSSKTPSATPPPAPLAIPFTLREQFLC